MKTVESYFDEEAIIKQAKRVRRKKSHGIDGISAKEAVCIAETQHSSIKEGVLTVSYKPSPILKITIPKGNGKERIIGSANTIDRIVQGCIHNYLYDVLDESMSDSSYGFRNNRNCQMAVLDVVDIIKAGYEWVISIDLKDCFTNLDKDVILWLLRNTVVDERIIKNVNKIISNTYVNGNLLETVQGCPQGSNISPDLCNLVLNQLDVKLEERNHPFVRYADDIYVFCKSEKAAIRTMNSIVKILEVELKLIVNRDKSLIFHSKNKVWSCLGFLIKHDVDIHIYMNPKKDENLRNGIKTTLSEEAPDKWVQDINSLTCGWICCNSIAEISSATKRMDAYIKRMIGKQERKLGVEVDTSKLKNCHGYYKSLVQQNKAKEKEPDSVGNTATEKCNNQPLQAYENGANVSLSVRAPPASDSS